LWAEIYDRKLTDIFAVESDIAKTIADALQAKLTGSEKRMMAAQPTSDTTAYELYHKGRSLWGKRTGDNIPKAIAFYEQAITREYKRAIELKPNDADAHHWFSNDSLAALGQFDEAIAEGKRSVELDPLSIVINADLGETLFYARRFDESVAQLRKTLEIDPTS